MDDERKGNPYTQSVDAIVLAQDRIYSPDMSQLDYISAPTHLKCDLAAFQRIFNAHTCLRQLPSVLKALSKLASLTNDYTQYR